MNFSEWISNGNIEHHMFRSAVPEGCDVDKLLSLMCMVCKARVDNPNFSVYDAAARMTLLDMSGRISSQDAGIMVGTFIPLMFGLDTHSEEEKRSYQVETFAAAVREAAGIMKEKHPDKARDIEDQCAAAIDTMRNLTKVDISSEDFSQEVMKKFLAKLGERR